MLDMSTKYIDKHEHKYTYEGIRYTNISYISINIYYIHVFVIIMPWKLRFGLKQVWQVFLIQLPLNMKCGFMNLILTIGPWPSPENYPVVGNSNLSSGCKIASKWCMSLVFTWVFPEEFRSSTYCIYIYTYVFYQIIINYWFVREISTINWIVKQTKTHCFRSRKPMETR